MAQPDLRPAQHRILVGGPSVPTRPGARGVTRRGILKLGFWVSIFAALGGAGATLMNMLYPRKTEPFGGPVAVQASDIPRPGAAPKQNIEGHFLLVNLARDEGKIAGDEAPSAGGLLALWWKCPHLGCTVPWKETFVSPYDPENRRGWFNCNCHGSTYTRAGVRIYGPAPRSMDTMQITAAKDGGIIVNTGKRTDGDTGNPRRAVPYPPRA